MQVMVVLHSCGGVAMVRRRDHSQPVVAYGEPQPEVFPAEYLLSVGDRAPELLYGAGVLEKIQRLRKEASDKGEPFEVLRFG